MHRFYTPCPISAGVIGRPAQTSVCGVLRRLWLEGSPRLCPHGRFRIRRFSCSCPRRSCRANLSGYCYIRGNGNARCQLIICAIPRTPSIMVRWRGRQYNNCTSVRPTSQRPCLIAVELIGSQKKLLVSSAHLFLICQHFVASPDQSLVMIEAWTTHALGGHRPWLGWWAR